jgi:RNA polymerase sigma-70 factor (ECF subfamily)
MRMPVRVWRATCHKRNMLQKSEPELIDAGKRGDTAAIAELFERHYPSSLDVARRILRSEEESQDAVQSAYFAAFRNLHGFRGDAAFKTWITRIVTNYCLMRLRQPEIRTRWINLDTLSANQGSLLASHAPSPEKSAFCEEIAAALSAAASALPKSLCEVFHLHANSGLSLKEVAAEMGLTLPAAKSRLFRANARMRKRLQPIWSNTRGPAPRRSVPIPRGGEVGKKAA